jgi:hypothetical protein
MQSTLSVINNLLNLLSADGCFEVQSNRAKCWMKLSGDTLTIDILFFHLEIMAAKLSHRDATIPSVRCHEKSSCIQSSGLTMYRVYCLGPRGLVRGQLSWDPHIQFTRELFLHVAPVLMIKPYTGVIDWNPGLFFFWGGDRGHYLELQTYSSHANFFYV